MKNNNLNQVLANYMAHEPHLAHHLFFYSVTGKGDFDIYNGLRKSE